MLNNLRAEKSRYGIRAKDFAELLNVREATISFKMRGKRSFTLDEAIEIRRIYFPHLEIEYLFKKGECNGFSH